MTPEEEAKMINEDHEVWKSVQDFIREINHACENKKETDDKKEESDEKR